MSQQPPLQPTPVPQDLPPVSQQPTPAPRRGIFSALGNWFRHRRS
jgi:hypothetical protein